MFLWQLLRGCALHSTGGNPIRTNGPMKSTASADSSRGFIPTRRSLLTRLKRYDDQEGWQAFFDTYWRLIYRVARAAGLGDADAQEVVQETVISVANKMADFKYDPALGSFKSWLLQLSRRRIADQFRKRPRETAFPRPPSDQATHTAATARIPDPASLDLDAVWEAGWQQNLLSAALERVKREVNPLQYQLFELYALKEWPVAQVSHALGASAAQVYLAKARITKLVAREVRRLESGRL